MPRPGQDPDDPWRRPDSGDGSSSGPPAEHVPAPVDASQRHPPPLRRPVGAPPVHLRAAPPRQLPAQDMASLDAQEQRAQRVTWAVGAVAGAVLVVLTCLLCTRLLF
ncbi:hypothetical protein [Verrucosispora sioxanthis]|uniref:hypothetical protein n=1 Tax=Verrucosispora sioxanthis TaxID=2499994 RepID=UPI00209FEF3E|nr:hypothetical protein [Verrucosispora sioxanthis]